MVMSILQRNQPSQNTFCPRGQAFIQQVNHEKKNMKTTGSTHSYLSESFPLSLIRHKHAQIPTLQLQNMAFALSHSLAPTAETISPNTSGTLLLFFQKQTHFSSQNISLKQHCPSPLQVCTVCLCVCVCVCVCVCASCLQLCLNPC